MSLLKSTSVPGGYTAEFWTVSMYERFDYSIRRATVIFSLWKDEATYQAGVEPCIVERAARLVLTGDKFDAYFSKEVLKNSGQDVNALAYLAAKAEPMDFWFARSSRYLSDASDV